MRTAKLASSYSVSSTPQSTGALQPHQCARGSLGTGQGTPEVLPHIAYPESCLTTAFSDTNRQARVRSPTEMVRCCARVAVPVTTSRCEEDRPLRCTPVASR